MNRKTATEFLQAGIDHLKSRAATYDSPGGERSMGRAVSALNEITGLTVTEEQGWLLMTLLKAVRSQQGDYREDSYEDGAAYFSLMGETAAKTRFKTADMMEFVTWPGSDRPFSGFVAVKLRSGEVQHGFAELMDWHVDSRSPMGSDIVAWRAADPLNDDGFAVVPRWADAPPTATHLLKMSEHGGYAWAREQGGRFFDVRDASGFTSFHHGSWVTAECRPNLTAWNLANA